MGGGRWEGQFSSVQSLSHVQLCATPWTVAFQAPLSMGILPAYKKDLHDPDNHSGVITDIEPYILESEVKWALESITTNKASGGDGIPVELFQILKDDAVKVLHSTCQQIWKTQQWPQDWKRSVFIPIPKKGNAKDCPRPRRGPGTGSTGAPGGRWPHRS